MCIGDRAAEGIAEEWNKAGFPTERERICKYNIQSRRNATAGSSDATSFAMGVMQAEVAAGMPLSLVIVQTPEASLPQTKPPKPTSE